MPQDAAIHAGFGHKVRGFTAGPEVIAVGENSAMKYATSSSGGEE
jgi:hypothetical protein